MPQTIQSLFARLEEAAAVLDDPKLTRLIKTVGEGLGQSRLKIMVIGSTGSGRASVVNYLLGQSELLPTSPIPKQPLPLMVGYGQPPQVEAVGQIGTRALLTPTRFRSALTSSDVVYSRIEVKTDAEMLKTSEIRLETIRADRSASDWKELLGGTDFTLLVLKATALLSEQERQFVREVLHPAFGLARVAIVINGIDQVAPDERDSTVERVRAFLGSFESQPAILLFSALGAARGEDYHALDELVKEDLAERHSALKSAAVEQAVQLCLNELTEAATRQYALISTNRSDLQSLLDKLSNRNQWLDGRIERAQKRTDAFVNLLIQEQFLREIEGFSEALLAQLPAEVEPIGDVNLIKKKLPGYLEHLWVEFFNNRMTMIKQRLTTEMETVNGMIAADLKELIGEGSGGFKGVLQSFDPTPANLRSFLMPRRGDTPQATFATALQLGGLVLIIGNLPLGLLTIGAGQLVRTIFNRSNTASDKRAIMVSANAAIRELESQIKRQVEQQFDDLAANLRQAINDLYRGGVADMRGNVQTILEQYDDLEARKAPLGHLLEVTLPDLRHEVADFG